MEVGRRQTRAALAEIPARLDRLRVTPDPLNRDRSPSLPAGYLSPATSPDELVIQQRGRRRAPVTWSPDFELKRNATFHSAVRTPPKTAPNQVAKQLSLRSTPRKRLLLGETERIPLTPEKIDFSDVSTPKKFKITSPVKTVPPIKRQRLDLFSESPGPLNSALKGLSSKQLMDIINGLVQRHSELEREVRTMMPAPDLAPLEEKLNYLKSNIFKSLPQNRLTSKTDSPAYSRVAIHMAAFKKCTIEQGKLLVESQHWHSVLKYVLMAWSFVRATPFWDSSLHNGPRKQCFKSLSSFCLTALKKANLDHDQLVDLYEKLQSLVADSDDIQSCVKYLQGQLNVMS